MAKKDDEKCKREEFARLILEEGLTLAEAARRVKLAGSYSYKLRQGLESPRHRAGRRRRNSIEETQQAIDEYFRTRQPEYLTDSEGNYVRTKSGDPVIKNLNAPTVTGLALACGYLSVESFNNAILSGNKLAQVLLRAKSLVTESYEQKLHMPGCQGSIFALENQAGWRKPIEISQTSRVKVENRMADELLDMASAFLDKFGHPKETADDTDQA